MAAVRPFLAAEWRWLAMLNYEVPPKLLAPYVPAGTAIDTWQGKSYVSVVGFMFLKTRLLGMPIPWHRNFEEVNLRFYVRREAADGVHRGVTFIKELAPRRAVSVIARFFYNENYVTLPMRHRLALDRERLAADGTVEYAWRLGRRWNHLAATVVGECRLAEPGSHGEHITGNYYGYSVQRDGGAVEYRVDHPPWRIWEVRDAHLDCDAALLYGSAFAEVLCRPPDTALVADGSPVVVYRGRRL